jgi:hypothetical protein
MNKLYVAYGSNLHLEQMAIRCPDAKPICAGIVTDFKLLFRGSKTGAYCDIQYSKGDYVPVLIWEISEQDEINLDRYEGYPYFYTKVDLAVRVKTESAYELKYPCMAYVMNQRYRPVLPGYPSDNYVETVKVGYIQNDFDLEYLNAALEYNMEEMQNCKK